MQHLKKYGLIFILHCQSSGAVWKSRWWTSRAPGRSLMVLMASVDVKQHWPFELIVHCTFTQSMHLVFFLVWAERAMKWAINSGVITEAVSFDRCVAQWLWSSILLLLVMRPWSILSLHERILCTRKANTKRLSHLFFVVSDWARLVGMIGSRSAMLTSVTTNL